MLAALRKQNSQTTLFAVGDDWQAIYRSSGAQRRSPPLSMKTLVKAIAVI
ncbi:hypothetical protein ACVXHB_08460 [Escherichia coli]